MGQPTVFSQVIKLVPRADFQTSVHKHRGDHGVRRLDCWSWFGALLFGQLTGHDSIRAIERVFGHADLRMRSLGFGTIKKSTLADANQSRPLAILEETFSALLARAKMLAPGHGFPFQGHVLALDASIIDLSLKLMPWARFRHDEACVKLHTAIDLAGDLPELVVIAPGTIQDMKIARLRLRFAKGTTVVFDKGYSQYAWYRRLHDEGVYFVTRQKDYARHKVLRSRSTDRTRGYICDQDVRIAGVISRRAGLEEIKLRRVAYRDPDTGKKLVFLTNRFDLDTKTVCDLYKARWKVELFFKTLKQNLKIKKFLGTTPHAVRAQIWVALIAYLLVQILRFGLKARISVPDTMAVLGVLLLIREPLSVLLGNLPIVTRHPRDFQLVLNL